MKIWIRLIVAGLSISAANAGKTYTQSQINEMVNTGNFPEQKLVDTKTHKTSFRACKAAANRMMADIGATYPVEEIVTTRALYMVKMFTNTGTVLITCSKPDETMVLSISDYQ